MSVILNPSRSELALHGGTPVRSEPMPARLSLGPEEEAAMIEAVHYYRKLGLDPGYQGHFEERYCAAFCEYLGGGFADAVATGTAALYIAVAALKLPQGSEVLVSPITDPGTLSAIILNGLVPRLIDSRPGSYNVGVDEFVARITTATKAAIIVHSIGQPAEADKISVAARERGILTIEDCSQSHGARCGGEMIGTFGDIAAFSTMYRKAHITGGAGGVVYAKDESLHRVALAYADRGKPRWKKDFDDRDPTGYLFPALNLHADEISCAIGITSLARLPATIAARQKFVRSVARGLEKANGACKVVVWSDEDSPFILPIAVDLAGLSCDKLEFAKALLAEGINLNPHYKYLVRDWPWLRPYLADSFETANARAARDTSFCVYLNENYGEREVRDALEAIAKVEAHFSL